MTQVENDPDLKYLVAARKNRPTAEDFHSKTMIVTESLYL